MGSGRQDGWASPQGRAGVHNSKELLAGARNGQPHSGGNRLARTAGGQGRVSSAVGLGHSLWGPWAPLGRQASPSRTQAYLALHSERNGSRRGSGPSSLHPKCCPSRWPGRTSPGSAMSPLGLQLLKGKTPRKSGKGCFPKLSLRTREGVTWAESEAAQPREAPAGGCGVLVPMPGQAAPPAPGVPATVSEPRGDLRVVRLSLDRGGMGGGWRLPCWRGRGGRYSGWRGRGRPPDQG